MDPMYYFVAVLGLVGAFLAGFLYGRAPLPPTRLKCIKLEHALARLENRRPRDIDDIA